MENLESKLSNVYTALTDSLGTAAIYAGEIRNLRIRKKVNELLTEEAKHFRQFRKQLFDLLNE